MQKIHIKLLLFLTVVAGAVGVGAYLMHRDRVERQRQAWEVLLRKADGERENGRLEEAAALYKKCLKLDPNSLAVRASLGMALEELADSSDKKQQALLVIEKVLRQAPDRSDLRRLAVGLAMDLGRPLDALPHLKFLRAGDPENAELLELTGECYQATLQYRKAAEAFESAIGLAPDRFSCYRQLANLLHTRLNQADRAAALLDEMVALNQESCQAFLVRGRYRKENGMLEQAKADLAHCLQLDSGDADVLVANIEVEPEPEAARRLILRGLELHPSDVRFLEKIALLEIRAGEFEQAIKALRRGTLALPNNVDVIWYLAELLAATGQLQESNEIFRRLKEKENRTDHIDYIDARLLWHEGQRLAAARLLERTAPKLARSDELWKLANLVLANYHDQLGQPDRQLADCQRVVNEDPVSVEGNLGLALALLTLQRPEEALDQCRHSRKLPGLSSPEWLLLAEQSISRNQRLSRSKWDWQLVAQLIGASKDRLPDSTKELLRRTATLLEEDRVEESLQVIARACQQNPQHITLWTTRAFLTELREAGGGRLEAGGSSENVMKVFEEAQQLLGNRVELQLALIDFWVRHGGPEAKAALLELADDLPADQAVRLSYALANAFVLRREFAEAERLWNRLAEQRPEDLPSRQNLFELAHFRGDAKEMARFLRQIRRLEGPEGTFWRCGEAARDILLARQGETLSLEKAQMTLIDLIDQRPHWRLPLLYLAQLEEIQGRTKQAVVHYRRAITLGVRKPDVILHTARLFASEQQFEEADDLIRKLDKDHPISGEAARLAAEIVIHVDDPQRALKYAQRASPRDSRDFQDWLWLSRFFQLAGQPQGAEDALRRAVELGSGEPEPLIALVRFLASSGRNDEAEVAIEEVRDTLAEDQTLLVLARCQQMLGNLGAAQKLYEAAKAQSPDDLRILRSLAEFHLYHGEPSKSVPSFRRILEDRKLKAPEEVRSAARRGLAIGLAVEADYQQFQKSLQLLDESDQTPQDQIARAKVLATRDIARHRSEAIAILEELDRHKKLSADDRFLLATLHDAASDWTKARAVFRGLLRSADLEGNFLAYYVQGLILRGRIGEAQTWCDLLAKLEPRSPRTIGLRASLLATKGKFARATRLLEALVDEKEPGSDEWARRLESAAAFAEKLGLSFGRMGSPAEAKKQFESSEEMYRQLAGQRPDFVPALARFLIRRGFTDKALALCQSAWKTSPPGVVAATGAYVLRMTPNPTAEQMNALERQLTAALGEYPQAAAELRIWLADLRLLERRFEDAAKLYRQVLAEAPNSAMAANNLAYLIAQDPDREAEALALINRTIELAGPTPTILDTRALVHLNQGRGRLALDDLTEEVGEDPSPEKQLHRVWAYSLLGNRAEAEAAFRKAQQMGLRVDRLFPADRKFLKRWQQSSRQ